MVMVLMLAVSNAAHALSPQVVISGPGQVVDSGPGPKVAHFLVEVSFDYPLIDCLPESPDCNRKTVNVCVDFHTVAGTAAANVDFVPKSGTLSKTLVFDGADFLSVGPIDVEVVGDALTEGPEKFKVVITRSESNCQNEASLKVFEATGTIIDDEGPQPDLTVSRINLLRGCGIELTIQNAGAGALSDEAYDPANGVALQMQRNREAWGGIRLSAVDPNKKLKVPGASIKHVWFPAAANLRLSKGSHRLRVTIDRFNAVAESEKSNNVTTSQVFCTR